MASAHDPQTEGERRSTVSDRWWSPFRTAGDADVVHVDLTPQLDREREALRLLNGQEQARWSGFRVDAPRREFALCRAALRVILCQRLACSNEELTFEEGEHGKPSAMVRGQPASVSLSQNRPVALVSGQADVRRSDDRCCGPKKKPRNRPGLFQVTWCKNARSCS